MTTILLVAALVPGQYRQCQTAASYRQTYAVQSYAAPAYYQQAYYARPYLDVRFAPVIHEAPYYSGLVGGEARARNRREQELESRADLAARVDKLSGAINGLASRITPAVVQPPPVAPGKPIPDVPGKPVPEQPPVPITNPDDGGVGPPPTVPAPPAPGVGGIPAPDAATLAILTNQCAKCHTAPAKGGKGVVLFTEPGKLAPLGPLDLVIIDQQVYSGAMPYKAEPMSAEDYSKLRAWINGSQPAIEAALRAARPKTAE